MSGDAADDQDPSWSPDGTQVAFGSKRQDPASDLYVMPVNDVENKQRIYTHEGFDGHPAWRSNKAP
jgi:Tol biopolymer transport system component